MGRHGRSTHTLTCCTHNLSIRSIQIPPTGPTFAPSILYSLWFASRDQAGIDTIQYEHGEHSIFEAAACWMSGFEVTCTFSHLDSFPLIVSKNSVFGPILGGFAAGVVMLNLFPDEPQWQQPL